jgi:DNA mismatch endonuclease (patch repair protein)
MAKIGSKNTRPEMLVRSAAHRLGLRFRLHRRDLPGSPDVVLPRHRTVLFVHGCFWHRHAHCPRSSMPVSNPEFWKTKFERNVARDLEAKTALEAQGWRVLVIWECQTKSRLGLEARLAQWFPDSADDWRVLSGNARHRHGRDYPSSAGGGCDGAMTGEPRTRRQASPRRRRTAC